LAFNAVGGISPETAPGTLALPSQFLDFTTSRPRTLFEPPHFAMQHVDMTTPYCPALRESVAAAAEELGLAVVSEVVYVCTEGPRFETPAEIEMFAQWGGDVVGMTGVPEVVFAREQGLCYASVCTVANWAAGRSDGPLHSSEVMELMAAQYDNLVALVAAVASRSEGLGPCACGDSLG
jgi:5'-methylthioadenosine phosphorylase